VRLSVVPTVQIDARQRPEPPRRLSGEEKQVWREVTSARRPDWFYGAEIVENCQSVACDLALYCIVEGIKFIVHESSS
jgi:hypothetical protein